MKDAVKNAMQQVWNDIAPDLFAACGEEEFSKAEVIDFVLDASRMETCSYLSAAEQAYYNALSFDEKDALAYAAFTYEVYCG